MTLTSATATLLEKVAVDNGFDRELPAAGDWLSFASTHSPLQIWLTALGDSLFLVALSMENVARALADHGTAFSNPLPPGAVAARGLPELPALHRALRRAFQLSRSLPNEILRTFEEQTATLPRSTEVERLVVQRVGQSLFREGLLDYWDGRCAVTGLEVRTLLRASHIKPWSVCANDAERLDVFNGLLLAPQLDAAFDCGLISVSDEGQILVSGRLTSESREILGLAAASRIRRLTDRHRHYLPWHRGKVFTP